MEPVTKLLNERDKILFEKALKFYFFSRQQDIRRLQSSLQKRLNYTGSVAYSLLITYIREGKFKLEYMDFLNEELKTLLSLDSNLFKKLHIKPGEIDEIELNEKIQLKFYDEDLASDLMMEYRPEQLSVVLSSI